jgi:hypothetical protein
VSPKIRQIFSGLQSALLVAFLADFCAAQWGTNGNPTPLTGTPGMTTIPHNSTLGPTTVFQQPTYDPYSTQPNASLQPPSLLSPPPATGFGTQPAPGFQQPYSGQPPAQPYYGQPPAYSGFGTQAPPTLFPQGLFGTPQTVPQAFGSPPAMRLLQNLQLSDGWLYGKSDGDLQIHDIYTSATFAFPNFLWSGQPWYVSPGFGLHLWSDPAEDGTRVALPPRAYSPFLDLGWKSDPNVAFGVELAGRLGYYSDFSTSSSQAFRPMGVALLRYNLTPNLAIKAGVDYINRADIKILPAGGFLWTPNPKTHFDVYFPRPRLASYLTTLGTRDLWWYIGGEYGGGVWHVTLDDSIPAFPGLQPAPTLMDINDMRVFIGIEITQTSGAGPGKRNAFVEVGYVFEREVVLVEFPTESYSVGETIMLRGGLAF